MKKTICLLLAALMLFACACGKQETGAEARQKPGFQSRLLPGLPEGGLGLGLPGLHVALGEAVVACPGLHEDEAGLPGLPGKGHGPGAVL